MNRVCVIIPYFGKWPSFFSFFLKGCLHNPDFTILFFTDLEPPSEYPRNVQFHRISLKEIESLLDSVVGFKTALSLPYKLCDVKPAYGLVFKDYIKEYDFWGWSDIDVIYGDMKAFRVLDHIGEFDVVSFRSKWISGGFCLLRNKESVNELFLSSPDVQRVFSSSAYVCFDEISFCWDIARKHRLNEIRFPHDNFTRLVCQASDEGKIRAQFSDGIKESISLNGYLKWEHGSLIDENGDRHLVYHYITEKRNACFTYPKWRTVPETFYIDNTGFFTEGEFLNRRGLIRTKRKLLSFPRVVKRYAERAKRKFA